MGFVMVPVPEEHVEEAMAMVLRITNRARLGPWDQEAVTDFFEEMDEPSRSVASAAAKHALANTPVSDRELAESIELTQREVLAICRELNEIASSQGRQPLMVMVQDVHTLANGRTREQRMVTVLPEVAAFIRDAEAAELAANPHPLLGDLG